MAGISGQGRDTERAFCALTGAHPAARSADGDAVLEGQLFEIKKASTPTLNQVRAVKYITLVAYDVARDVWFVVPAHEVVRLVSLKHRGQHTENPFESATLSLIDVAHYRVETSELRDACLTAAALAKNVPEVATAMHRVLELSQALAADCRTLVADALREAGMLPPG